jgi:8-oxo-dGTP pyrophosphatase MutT (NUDIX family)
MLAGSPQYLMVQRKDSLCYVEFIRGKYSLQNRGYINKLLSNMTVEERVRLRTLDFDTLWSNFWRTDQHMTFAKEYEQSKRSFDTLRRGYKLRAAGSEHQQLVDFSLDVAIATTTSPHTETEFGFSKGRRNINESDLRCACREFTEETGLGMDRIAILCAVKPFDEIFTGSNKVRYKHVYYLAKTRDDRTDLPRLDTMQQKEIRSVGWYDFDGVMCRIRAEHVERQEMFKLVHAWVVNHEARWFD